MIKIRRGSSVSITVGQTWLMRFDVLDYAYAAVDTPVVTVTLPDGSTAAATVTAPSAWSTESCYQALYVPLTPGRFSAQAVTTSHGTASALAVVRPVTIDLPDAIDLDGWLGGASEHSWEEAELADALTAETAAQMRMCRVPASYDADLREALLRRAARNLFMRRQLTAEPRGEGDIDLPNVLPVAADPEIRRLEKPWRRLPIG